MKNLALFFFLFCIICSLSAQGWDEVSSPTNSNLNDVFFTDSTNGWIVGDSALILKHTENGWNKISHGLSEKNLNAVCFTDSSHGWIVGDSGTILKYLHGEFSICKSPTAMDLVDIAMIDSMKGWIICSSDSILKIENDIRLIYLKSYSNYILSEIHMLDANHGVILSTENNYWYFNGSSWQVRYIDGTALFGTCSFIDSSTVFLAYSGAFAMAEGGKSYSTIAFDNYDEEFSGSSQYHSSERMYFNAMHLFTDTTGWLLANNKIFFYDDGQLTKIKTVAYNLNSISFINHNNGWIVGGNGKIYKFNSSITNINPPVANEKWSIYPNPFDKEITIKNNNPISVSEMAQINIYDISGSKVYKCNKILENNMIVLDLELQPGIYFLEISNDKNKFIQKVIKP